MSQLADFSIKPYVTHIDDHEWKEVGDGLRIKELICDEKVGKSEFYFGLAELEAGKDIPLVKSNLACCTHILEGEIWARLGRQRIQMEREGSNYFPIGLPYSYEASGTKGVRFLFCYAVDNEIGEKGLKREPASDEEARQIYVPNCPNNLMTPSLPSTTYRWAAAGDGDPWHIVEYAQGTRSLVYQDQFDDTLGNKEFWWGRCHIRPNCRYTPHFHVQPEVFYFISGTGTMFAGNNTYKVRPGSLIYAPKFCVHGMVNDGPETLVSLFTCNLETAGNSYDRIEICDVPLVTPHNRDDWMFSKI